jgi:hypothetical protein
MTNLCNGCWRPLIGPIPDDPIAQVQCQCGFICVFESNVTEFPLKEELLLVTDAATAGELASDSDDSDYCQKVIGRTFQLFLEGARKAVESDPPTAVAVRWPTLVEFDRRSRRFRAGDRGESWSLIAASRAVQILEACVFEFGIMGVDDGREVPRLRMQKFLDSFFRFATSAGTLAPMLDNLDPGRSDCDRQRRPLPISEDSRSQPIPRVGPEPRAGGANCAAEIWRRGIVQYGRRTGSGTLARILACDWTRSFCWSASAVE